MKLTNNFALSEIDNGDKLAPWQLRTLYCLLLFCVQPMRAALKERMAFSVGGGYRLEPVDGGSATSEHFYGKGQPADDPASWIGALDFYFKDKPDDHMLRLKAFEWLMANCRFSFGQLIWYLETNHGHISLASKSHQGQVLLCVSKARSEYKPITSTAQIVALDPRI